jgi:hypothetical protein
MFYHHDKIRKINTKSLEDLICIATRVKYLHIEKDMCIVQGDNKIKDFSRLILISMETNNKYVYKLLLEN